MIARTKNQGPEPAPTGDTSAPFVPPEGWTRSPNVSTSRFAFEMSNTTRWYTNDGQGNGYFAPDWDSERIARRTGAFRWIAVALAMIMIAGGAILASAQYGEQIEYNQLKSTGVQTTGVVGPVTVEHTSEQVRRSGRSYTTRSTSTLDYTVGGQEMREEITASSSTKIRRSPDRYPEPAWTQGQELRIYADPEEPERFVLVHEYKEADADSLPRGVIIIMIITGVLLILPLVLFHAGARNVREARKL
ncbi:DUF3592 domain-containing protein [Citricoccus muralis]|uniref:DUF3592 domain-containing protein n=1 Tax=Citricoccus muralis TaxID=169134 RepID=A0A3D9LF04_9MICC|nr:DUF3592 domain-containing protein [Citricoccus muralis]REE04226.1 hypothetical protein C8E99_2053 [Citricoccus muralis]